MSTSNAVSSQTLGLEKFLALSQIKAQRPVEPDPDSEPQKGTVVTAEPSAYELDATNTPAEATANALAIGVETVPGQVEMLANRLNLGINPNANATASSQDLGSTVSAEAESIGQGLGHSRFTTETDSPFYQSDASKGALSLLITSEGEINGESNSEAFATGAGSTAARARSLNVALANLNLLGR
jgi:hypothetical protein